MHAHRVDLLLVHNMIMEFISCIIMMHMIINIMDNTIQYCKFEINDYLTINPALSYVVMCSFE